MAIDVDRGCPTVYMYPNSIYHWLSRKGWMKQKDGGLVEFNRGEYY